VRHLDEVCAEHGYPKAISVDSGPELISNALDRWAHQRGVALHFMDPGNPRRTPSSRASTGAFGASASMPAGSSHSLTPAKSSPSGGAPTTQRLAASRRWSTKEARKRNFGHQRWSEVGGQITTLRSLPEVPEQRFCRTLRERLLRSNQVKKRVGFSPRHAVRQPTELRSARPARAGHRPPDTRTRGTSCVLRGSGVH